MAKERVLREITPLMDNEFMYVADRHKQEFTYPIHSHDVFELNFVTGAAGVHRIVGDSTEVIGDYDLVLITSPNLEHAWVQGDCHNKNIREITIQFRIPLTSNKSFFSLAPMKSIEQMFIRAQKGLAFPLDVIIKVYPMLDRLSKAGEGFYAMIDLFTILYELSKCDGAHELASSTFAKVNVNTESRRILKV